jgi:hypothetical protein
MTIARANKETKALIKSPRRIKIVNGKNEVIEGAGHVE